MERSDANAWAAMRNLLWPDEDRSLLAVPDVEGWFVVATARGRGIGRSLMSAAEIWARGHEYSELTSDGLLENEIGYRAHMGAG